MVNLDSMLSSATEVARWNVRQNMRENYDKKHNLHTNNNKSISNTEVIQRKHEIELQNKISQELSEILSMDYLDEQDEEGIDMSFSDTLLQAELEEKIFNHTSNKLDTTENYISFSDNTLDNEVLNKTLLP